MKIESQKDLAKLIALCRKTGVQSIRVDNVEFHLGDQPFEQPKHSVMTKSSISLPKAQVVTTSGPDVVESDEMTEEQLLMWSVSDTPDASASEQN